MIKVFLIGVIVGIAAGYALGSFVDKIDRGIKNGRG
jgi:hypothetical protein